jgi:hypothetical protein
VATGIVCAVILLEAIHRVFGSIFENMDTLGSHDWDEMESNRYLAVKTILRFHQFPFWNPYACGGHPAWGAAESVPNVISPWLPAYLLTSLPRAIRIEIVGSALIGAIGAWLFASRFTSSRAIRLLLAVLFALNGRVTLQIAVGHAWHATYCYMPWVLYFYERAASPDPVGASRRRDIVMTAVFLAVLTYTGGIYPLPHTAVLLVGYALCLSLTTHSLVPLTRMVRCGLLGAALAAPRLLPVIEVTRRFPRLADSTETMDLSGFFTMLTAEGQDTWSAPTRVPQWGWHEWGMYIGLPSVMAILVGSLAARGARERSLRIAGVLALLVAFGAFSDYAPWTLLHRAPPFSSQHVPTRWMMPALLLLAAVAASSAERLLAGTRRARWALEIGATFVVAFVVRDLCAGARTPITHAFQRSMPTVADSVTPFRTVHHVPPELDYDPDEWSPSTLSAVVANIGTIDCNTFHGFSNYTRGRNRRSPGMGAYGEGDALYRGEVYLADGPGTAKIVHWTPNDVVVQVDGAHPGDRVVLDQNWDPGWSANGVAAPAWHDAVSALVAAPSATVRFRYRPPTLILGLTVFTLCLLAPAALPIVRRLKPRSARLLGRLIGHPAWWPSVSA